MGLIGNIKKFGNTSMEQIIKSLLQKQGYSHIGLVDSAKGIWGYAKDGIFHFSTEDLTEVDREEVGLINEVDIITIRDENIECIKTDCANLPSAIILDKQNRILNVLPASSPSYVFKRINNNSVIIVKGIYKYNGIPNRKWEVNNIWSAYQFEEPKESSIDFFNQTDIYKGKGAFIYLDGKLKNDTYLYLYYKDYYFFICNGDLEVYHPQLGVVFNAWKKEEDYYDSPDAILWICKGIGSFFIHNKDCMTGLEETGKVFVTPLGSSMPMTLRLSELAKNTNINEGKSKERVYISEALSSEDYLLIPISSSFGSILSVHMCNNGISARILDIDIHKRTIKFQNGIIEAVYRPYYSDNYYIQYYDAEGNALNEKYDNRQYLIYGKYVYEDNQYKEKYGVLRKEDCKQILKPIYNRISFGGDDTFEVEMSNNVNGDNQSLKSLYHAKKGFLLPIGIEYHHPEYWNNITGISINTAKAEHFNIFSFGEHEGLMLGSEKVLEPIYDSIEGFHFWEKFNEDEDSWNYDRQETERKTKEYLPLSVILNKDGKHGLFIDKEHIIEPIFDRIDCCKVLKGNAYFKVQAGDKYGIISDNIEFNERNKVLYDNVEIEDRYSDYKEQYFKLYKNGKIGMISTNPNYSIPVQFNNLIIYPKCYIGDGFIYSRNGQKLLSEKDYEIIEEETLIILRNISSKEYVVYNYLGNLLDSNIKKGSEDVIEIKGRESCYEYDIHNMTLIKIDNNAYYQGDDYPTEDEIERGIKEAYNGDPEALWNTE